MFHHDHFLSLVFEMADINLVIKCNTLKEI